MAEDGEQIDDMTIGLQMQQFLDEWNYRVIHAGMATSWDHHDTMYTAISLFQAHGVVISEEEKLRLASSDEEHVIPVLVRKMTPGQRRTFEHFALQLQLFISAATRVRNSINDGEPDEIRRVVEEGDKAITQHILKQTVVEAAQEVFELKSVHDGWSDSMNRRINRLTRTAESTEAARAELEKINRDIEAFSKTQNEKSKRVLMSLADKSEKGALKAVFHGWQAYHAKYQSEKDIHEKFRAQIQMATEKLWSFKAEKIESVRKVMRGTAEHNDRVLVATSLQGWIQLLKDAKEEVQLQRSLLETQAKLAGMRDSQKSAAKNSLMRLAQGNESAMLGMFFQSWTAFAEESKKDAAVNGKVREFEDRLKTCKVTSRQNAKGVLERMAGSMSTDVLLEVMRVWSADIRGEKQEKAHGQKMAAMDTSLANLRSCQKGKAFGVAENAIELERENMLMKVFMNWQMEVQLARVVRHYSGQMETKKRQLESVRTMFNQFANQLGEISNTPRKGSSKPPRQHHGDPKRSSVAQESGPAP